MIEQQDDLNPPDDSALADAERDMLASLQPGQHELIGDWLRLYGLAFAATAPSHCRPRIRTNFAYAGNRLEVLGKQPKD